MAKQKTMTWEELKKELENSGAVVIGDSFLTNPIFEGDDLLQFLHNDGEGQTWEWEFEREGNETVKVFGSSIFLKDADGEEEHLTILVPKEF